MGLGLLVTAAVKRYPQCSGLGEQLLKWGKACSVGLRPDAGLAWTTASGCKEGHVSTPFDHPRMPSQC